MLQAASQGSHTLLAQRYRILRKIGEGGFGTVYQALDENPPRKPWDKKPPARMVAIKQINLLGLSSQDQIEVTDSYNREITLLSRLHHKNLPRLHDHFTDPEHWYIVMDYINGETLEDILKTAQLGRLPAWRVREIGLQLCDVLTYLHNQQPPIIFRDIKPANVMLTRQGDLYLIDFGIARRYRLGQARDTMPLGSPGYAAPEQYGQGRTTTQTDLYGLGVTLQTLLTGKEPLDIALGDVPPQNCIPRVWRALLEQMMEKQPSQRPPDIRFVSQALSVHPPGVQTQMMRLRKFLIKKVIPSTFALILDDFFDKDAPGTKACVKLAGALISGLIGAIVISFLQVFLIGFGPLIKLAWMGLGLFVSYQLLSATCNLIFMFALLIYRILAASYRLLCLLYRLALLAWQRRHTVITAGQRLLTICSLLLQAGRHTWQSAMKAFRSSHKAKVLRPLQTTQTAQKPAQQSVPHPSHKPAKKHPSQEMPPLVYIPLAKPVYPPLKQTSRQPYWKKYNDWRHGMGAMQKSSKMHGQRQTNYSKH